VTVLHVNNWNCDTLKGKEAVASAYAMLQLRAGNWEFIPGMRFEHTDIKDTFWVIPKALDDTGNTYDVPGHFSNNYTHYDEALPSILVNYRPSANTVYRGAIWTSYERPPFVQLAGSSSVNPSANGTTTITEGNPNLKAITATNYDLSGEWKTDSGGFLTAAAFFKQIQHYLFDNGSSAENTTSTGAATGTGTLYIEPTNGGSAQVYGVEIGGRQKFKWLPAPFDGLGIEASATGEHTGVHLDETGLKPVERMQNAPNWMGNVEVFYEARGLELGVIYNYSGAFLVQYDYMSQHASWDDLWMRARQRVDLHAGYTFESGVKLDLGVANLLRNYQYWTHIGEHTLQDSDIVDSGTTAFFNVSYKF
jgi:TonB-dependent receptor